MSSFWWGQSALDELIEKATSELLPAGQIDLALHLEISDQIRSKKVNAKDAMRSLKQRLNHKNPNVILATLSLVDTCVKNSGSSFVKEVATREFMEEMTHLLKVPTGCNQDVKAKVLYLIQVWGIASKGNSSLSYISGTYSLLRAEGYAFPPVTERIDSILLETAVAPEWTDSDCCERCRTSFTLTNRKHHCRQCGTTFCQQCSSKNIPLPHLGINDTVRVCDGCYIKVKLAKVADRETVPHLLGTPSSISSLTPAYTPSIKNKNATTESNHMTTTAAATCNSNTVATSGAENDQFEDDIKKAIEMSLKESEQQKSVYPSGTIAENNNNSTTVNKKSAEEEEEESNLATAIAASLQDMNASTQYYTTTSTLPKYNSNELSSIDMENIQLFSTLMQRVQSAGSDISGDVQINKLYTQIGTLQSKLVKTLDEANQKHETFVSLHTKLNSAVKAYDKLLEERVSYAAQRTRAPSQSNYYGSYSNQIPPQTTSQYQYPTPPVAINYPAYPQTPITLPLSQPTADKPTQPQQQAYPYSQGQTVQTTVVQHQQPISYAAPPTPQVYPQPSTQYYPTLPTTAVPQQQQSYQTPVTPVQQQQTAIPPTQEPPQYQQQPFISTNITSAPTNYYNQPSNGSFNSNALQQSQQSTSYNKQPVEEAPLIEL